MAVDFDFLVPDLSIQNQIVDQFQSIDVSQLAAGAQVFFFKTDKVTPKNVYIQTGDPLNPFTVAPNPQTLTAAGAFEQKLWFYFFDEADDEPTNEELYYIQVVNAQTVTIYEVDNFVLNPPSSGGAAITTSIVNLAPDYGFDVLYRPNYYGTPYDVYISDVGTYPALGYVWVIKDPTVGDFYYRFVEPSIGTLEGDPLHYIELIEENFGSAQTDIFFAFPICQYQELIGSTLTLQFLAQDQSLAPVTSLDIGIVRGPSISADTQLIDWSQVASPTNVGSVTLTTGFELKTLTFMVPAVTVTPDESSSTYITIDVPKDQNFRIAMTGFYVYQGQDENITITRDNLGNRYSRVFAQAMNNFILSQDTNESNNLPLMRRGSQGSINYQNRTGAFFQAPKTALSSYNFALICSGQNVIQNYTYATGRSTDDDDVSEAEKEILGDRYLENIAPNIGSLGDNSFIVSNISGTGFDVQTVLVHAPYSPWASNSGALTITPLSNPSNHIVTAVQGTGSMDNTVDITFTTDYLALTYGYRANLTSPAGGGNNQYINGPDQNVMINWFGTITSGAGLPQATLNRLSGLTVNTTNNGSVSSQAEATITFPDGLTAAQLRTAYNLVETNTNSMVQYTNVLEFLNPEQSGAITLPATPPFAIQFHVDDVGDNCAVSDTLLTVNFSSGIIGTGAGLANFMVQSLNDGTFYNFDFTGVPANGESFDFSSTYKNFIGIFWITNQTQPTNPTPSRPAIYIEIPFGGSIQDVVDATAAAFTEKISSIPTADDLGISLGDELALYMEA